MRLTQYLDSNKRNFYNLIRVSTKSNYDVNKNKPDAFYFYAFLTKWLWYTKKVAVANASYTLVEKVDEMLKLESNYHEYLGNKEKKKKVLVLSEKREVNFEKMKLVDKIAPQGVVIYTLLRRPQFRTLNLSEIEKDRNNINGNKKKITTALLGKNICYINLSKIGKCLYGDKCGNEHIAQKYVWRIREGLVDESASFHDSSSNCLTNRKLAENECELIESAFCDPTKFTQIFRLKSDIYSELL
jgi:hypothetical protein